MKSKSVLRISVSLILAGLLLALFLKNVDFAELGRILREARTGFLVAATMVALASYWLRALRWQFILRSAGTVRHSSAVLATATGYAGMTLLPARAGDIIRPLLLAHRDRIPVSAALASMVTERVFDMATVLSFFVVFTIWMPPMHLADENATHYLELLGLSGYFFAGALIVGILCLLALFRFQSRFVDIVTRPIAWIRPSWRDPAINFFNHFLDGMRVLQRPRDLFLTCCASVILWLGIYWQVELTLLAFDLELPFRATFLIVMMAILGLLIPTPGGVGGFHKATQVGLTVFFATDRALATAVAIAYHAICFIPITVIGLACLPFFGLSWRQVGSLSAEDPGDEN